MGDQTLIDLRDHRAPCAQHHGTHERRVSDGGGSAKGRMAGGGSVWQVLFSESNDDITDVEVFGMPVGNSTIAQDDAMGGRDMVPGCIPVSYNVTDAIAILPRWASCAKNRLVCQMSAVNFRPDVEGFEQRF